MNITLNNDITKTILVYNEIIGMDVEKKVKNQKKITLSCFFGLTIGSKLNNLGEYRDKTRNQEALA